MNITLHAPPSAPTIFHNPIIPLMPVHEARHQCSMVELSSTILQYSIPIKKEIEVDGQGYRHWTFLDHIGETFTVVYPHTRVCVTANLKLSTA